MIQFKGMLYLDFESESEEVHYKAEVTRAIKRPNELVLDFKGMDPDSGPYSGRCSLAESKGIYKGVGEFSSKGDITSAFIEATAEEFEGGMHLQGTWTDDGETDSYKLEIELEI